jgi:hypothetical protein
MTFVGKLMDEFKLESEKVVVGVNVSRLGEETRERD